MNAKNVMAGRLLCGVVTALLVQGCLLPQDGQEVNDLPPKRNSPVRIRLDLKIFPSNTEVYEFALGTGCRHETFSVFVDDPDVGDSIRSRWFVDPDSDFMTAIPIQGRRIDPIDGGISLRTTRADAPPTLFMAGSRLHDFAGPHLVMLVVADNEFGEGNQPISLPPISLPDGGTVLNKATTDQYTWNVTTNTTDCTP